MTTLNLNGFNAEYLIKDDELNILAPMIEQWIKINREYIEEEKYEDALYLYNERSTVGSLAGAAWKCGGYAIEEYVAIKGKDKDEKNGRIDLLLNLSRKNIIIEAKQLWLQLYNQSQNDIKEKIKQSLTSATNDIKKTISSNDYGDFNIGVTFITPYWKGDVNKSINIESIREIICQLDTSIFIIFEPKEKVIHIDGDNYKMCIALFKKINS